MVGYIQSNPGLKVIKLLVSVFPYSVKPIYGRLMNVCKIKYGNMDKKYGNMDKKYGNMEKIA